MTYFLLRLPTPRPGEVLGLVGTNGIGKSTALKILAGKQKPNLGRFDVSFIDVVLIKVY
jgi:ATP-binding cassette subfamily E protein 1